MRPYTKRYLRITSFGVFSKDIADQQDLLDTKEGRLITFIDTHLNTYYDGDKNSWEEIK